MKIIYEIKNCLARREIHFISNLLMILSIVGFLMECFAVYDKKMSFLRSSAESSLIQGTYSVSIMGTILIMLPILSGIIFSDSIHTEFKSGVYKIILTRVPKKIYVLTKAVVIFVTTFFVFFIPFIVNQLLCILFFPSEGYDNIYSLPPYDIGFQNFHYEYLFDFLRVQHPIIYDLFFAFLISLFASSVAVLTFSVYFFTLEKNRMVGIVLVFGAYIVSTILFSTIGLDGFSLYDQITPGHIGDSVGLILWFIFLLVLSSFLIISKGVRKEWEL